MTLDGLLAIIGIIVAIYAIARPIQRQSIMLFVPWWIITSALLGSGVILLVLEAFTTWGVKPCVFVSFPLRTLALLAPIGAAVWGVCRWHGARLPKKRDRQFREFLLTSLRESQFDESVRILLRNRDCLAEVLSKETADLVFGRRFIRALVEARSWVHLELLTKEALLDLLPNHFAAVDRTIRELVAAEESPLRTFVLCEEGGDETLVPSDEEDRLIDRTFRNPQWYLKCRVGYPLLMTAQEILDSGELDRTYNRNDALYISRQGVSSRSRCPLFLGEKTIVYALKEAVEKQAEGDFYVTDLGGFFEDILEHSVYTPAIWDTPKRYCGEYPTPFAFLLSQISEDLHRLSKAAFRRAGRGKALPNEVARQLGVTWAQCVAYLASGQGHVSEGFRLRLVIRHFAFVLETLHPVEDDGQAPPHLGDWQDAFVGPLKNMFGPTETAAWAFLTEAANRLDRGRRNVFEHEDWLRDKLGLPPRPRPQR